MDISRRTVLKGMAAAACFPWGKAAFAAAPSTGVRSFHASISIDAIKADPDLPVVIRDAGAKHIWLACWFQGQFQYSVDEVRTYQAQLEKLGLAVHNITIPLGHPTWSQDLPDYMPKLGEKRWKRGVRPDGKTYGGVSLHSPITEENVAAIKQIKTTNPGRIFVDDDFRLAPSPDDIGGCFCDEHKAAFLKKHGYDEKRWPELIDDVSSRRYSTLVREWLDDTCDALTACFRAQQQAAAPEAEMGIMVMYLGAEKAGIRLTDYARVPMRVGELMFDDKSFAPVKGKTNELFSALFHRRFVKPELAFSETTAWPPDKLSAPNMAAKLAISTIADVRNTMFMSGVTPFPKTHWAVLAPAMKENARLHERVAGHTPRGPVKLFWGEHSRHIGDSNPYSLPLALGVPFEVVSKPAPTGWTFLTDFDARGLAADKPVADGQVVYHPGAGARLPKGRAVEETLPALFAFKKEIARELADVPYVVEDAPVVFAWYPTAKAALLWNLQEQQVKATVRHKERTREVTLSPLGISLVELAD